MATANAPAVRTSNGQLTIRQQLESDAFKASLAQILPKHLSAERMARVAITALTRTPQLRNCDQASFFRCLMDLSQWGLEPDGRRAHLIPFNNRKRGVVECQLIIDYKGLVELAMRSGTVSRIHSDVVCENDVFEYDRGELRAHRIDFRKPRGEVYAVYSLIAMKDGSEKCEVMSRDEVEAIRKRSMSGNNGPWVTDWNEMAKKTVFRRATKWLQLSAEVASAVYGDDDVIEGQLASPPRVENLDSLTDRLLGHDAEPDDPEPVTDGQGEIIEPEAAKQTDPPSPDEINALANIAAGLGCPEADCLTWAERAVIEARDAPAAFLEGKPWAAKGKGKSQKTLD